MLLLLTTAQAGALLGSVPGKTLQANRGPEVTMQANRRSVLGLSAAAACLAVVPSRAWAGYALQSANQNQHTWDATDKAKEQAVYDSIKSSIDAKRPDRPDLGTRESHPSQM